MPPTVSVLIPNYNHASFLKERIESVLAQTFINFELLLLDDQSTDGSRDILTTYKNHPKVSHFLLNELNSGTPFAQWVKGIELAQGKYIWIAESDDFAETTFLERTVALLEKAPNTSLVYTDSQIVDPNGTPVGYWKDDKNTYFKTDRWDTDYTTSGRDEMLHYLLYRTTINNASAVLFRSEILKRPVYLEKVVTYNNTGDLFTYLYASLHGAIGYLATPLNNYRRHPDNLTAGNRKAGKLHKERLRCFAEIFSQLDTASFSEVALSTLREASLFILNKNGYAATERGALPEVIGFIGILKEKGILSVKRATLLSRLFKAYASKNKLIRWVAKKWLKKSVLKR